MKEHPDKHIRAAIAYALARGWLFSTSSGSAHCFGRLKCGIAELTGVSRQAIALLKDGAPGSGQFPGPVQRVKGNSPLWRWQTVVEWLVAEGRIPAQSPVVAHARTLDSLNLALQLRASTESNTVLHYFQGLERTAARG